jgi:hypothetical protein
VGFAPLSPPYSLVMTGLVPAIHVFFAERRSPGEQSEPGACLASGNAFANTVLARGTPWTKSTVAPCWLLRMTGRCFLRMTGDTPHAATTLMRAVARVRGFARMMISTS